MPAAIEDIAADDQVTATGRPGAALIDDAGVPERRYQGAVGAVYVGHGDHAFCVRELPPAVVRGLRERRRTRGEQQAGQPGRLDQSM